MLAEMQIVQRHLDGLSERISIRQKIAPFTGDGSVEHVNEAIESKEPHKKEMQGHPFGQTMANSQKIEEAIREEIE
jgi:hypothetical protein